MGRPRNDVNSELPPNLYRRRIKNNPTLYYVYTDRIENKQMGLGTDKAYAIMTAMRKNRIAEEVMKAKHSGVHLENGIPKVRAGLIDEMGLFDKSTIIRATRAITPICGIYFLTHEKEIVYVGQSKDILLRLSLHMKQGTKEFTGFCVVEAPEERLNSLEAMYIAKFNPPCNIFRPSNCIELRNITE